MQLIIIIGLLLILAAGVGVLFVPHLRLFGVGPDIILITACCIAFLEGQSQGAAAGFVGGLIGDLLGGRPVGLSSLSKTITGYLAGSMKSGLTDDSALLPAGLITVFSFLSRLMHIFFSFLIMQPVVKGWAALGYLIIGSLYDALVAIPIFIICRKALARRTTGEYVREYSNLG